MIDNFDKVHKYMYCISKNIFPKGTKNHFFLQFSRFSFHSFSFYSHIWFFLLRSYPHTLPILNYVYLTLKDLTHFYPFFTVKQLLEDWAYSEIYVMVMPAIAAVAAVNVIIILYVISAFRQERRSFKTDWEYILLQFSFIASLQILSRSHGCM